MGLGMEYIFYTTNESFDYGDFPGSTCICFEPHGFEVDIEDGRVDLTTLQGFGDYGVEVEKVKTLIDLKEFIKKYKNEIYDYDETEFFKKVKKFEELEKILIIELKEQKLP